MQKIKTATFTFHASHNYGSMLQAYALQYVLRNEVRIENEIINFRSLSQKLLYSDPGLKKYNFKQKVKQLLFGNYHKFLVEKYNLFEQFMKEKMILSQEFNDEVAAAKYSREFDFLITGSDQIWNTVCSDFNWIYFLPFAKGNAIAYAPSMGPCGIKEVKKEHYLKIKECLQQYKAVSVREKGSVEVLNKILATDVETLVDPTLLVDSKEWDDLAGNKPIINGDYIFMYKPFLDNPICEMAKKISRSLGIPVVVSNILPSRMELYNKLPLTTKIKSKLDCGPIEFLNLIKYSKLVISGSYHAVAFSIIFNKPFLAVNGKTDNRMSHLLKATNLLDYGVGLDDFSSVLNKLPSICFDDAKAYVDSERNRSIAFLKKSMNL